MIQLSFKTCRIKEVRTTGILAHCLVCMVRKIIYGNRNQNPVSLQGWETVEKGDVYTHLSFLTEGWGQGSSGRAPV
jgi:hypothetical protein